MNQIKMNAFYKFSQTIPASQWLGVIETVQELQVSKISSDSSVVKCLSESIWTS